MKFTFDGKNYLLKFSHVVFENNRKKMKQATIARLYEVTEEGKKELATDLAECSSKDHYVKAYGRELALMRLTLQLPVLFADALYEAYTNSGAKLVPCADFFRIAYKDK